MMMNAEKEVCSTRRRQKHTGGPKGCRFFPWFEWGGGKTIQRDFEGSLSHLHAFLEKLK